MIFGSVCSGIEAASETGREVGGMEAKACSLCKQAKPLDEFHRQPRAKTGRHSWCKACYNARHPKKKQVAPERRRELNYRSRYALGTADISAMREAQGDVCPICEKPLAEGQFRVDHDHATGRVRGVLCHRCNIALPILEDHARLMRAFRYLGRGGPECDT